MATDTNTELEVGANEKRCAGIPKMGIAPHVAPKTAFAKASAFKDGLYRICKEHDGVYQAAWRKAKAEAEGKPAPQPRAAKATAPALPKDAKGETVGVAERRRRFEVAVEIANPDEREALLSAKGKAQAELVQGMAQRIDDYIALQARPARASEKAMAAAAKAKPATRKITPAPKPSAKAGSRKAAKAARVRKGKGA